MGELWQDTGSRVGIWVLTLPELKGRLAAEVADSREIGRAHSQYVDDLTTNLFVDRETAESAMLLRESGEQTSETRCKAPPKRGVVPGDPPGPGIESNESAALHPVWGVARLLRFPGYSQTRQKAKDRFAWAGFRFQEQREGHDRRTQPRCTRY